MLSAAAQLKLPGLQQMLDGQSIVGNELATHIEVTLALGQGWLDRKHELSDISSKTVDILQGKDISDFEEEIQRSEQKGLETMKTSTGSAPTSAALSASSEKPGASSEKPSNELIEIRRENLGVLTQARGAKSRLARVLEVSESIVSFLFNGKKDFSNKFSRDLEKALHLPAKWLDSPHAEKDVPQKTWDVLNAAAKGANQPLNLSSKSLELPSLKLNLTTEPTELERSENSSQKPQPLINDEASTDNTENTVSQDAATDKGQHVPPARTPRVHRLEKSKPAVQAPLTLQLHTTAAPSELFGGSQQTEMLPPLDDEAPTPPSDPVAENLPAAGVENVEAEPQTASGTAVEKVEPQAPVVTKRAPRRQVATPAAPAAAAAAEPGQESTASVTPTQAAPVQETPAQATSAQAAPAHPAAPALTPAAALPSASTTVILAAAPAALTGPAGAIAEPAINAAIESRPDVFILSPITEALIKTLTNKAREGTFTDKEAYKLLGQIADL
jgi:hypothetical protein